MIGVTILDTIEIYTLSWQQFVFGFTPLVIALIVSLIHLSVDYNKEKKRSTTSGTFNINYHKPWEILYCVIGGILTLAILFYLHTNCPADHLETQYKVKVDETTPFIEFYDKYEILEEHPEYFIVKDRGE